MLVAVGRNVPGGPLRPWWGEIPEADGSRWEPLTLGCAGGAVGSVQVFSRSETLVLVADVQREVMQGAANDGVGAVIKQLERQYMAVPPRNTVSARARSSGSCSGSRLCCGGICTWRWRWRYLYLGPLAAKAGLHPGGGEAQWNFVMDRVMFAVAKVESRQSNQRLQRISVEIGWPVAADGWAPCLVWSIGCV